ncbi:N(2)-acetyl-L-2,4-diaminobutanoate deacetylase DoeB [Sinorhizobium meliloti]|uniref:N(2)-acetyl-L-2,4-diaminobutanoate deacetylase DoeB n=1 Tax=Rhizobium meliloti TaxID=382 RepID=UPI0020914B6C|nr:N(2)-acetyl-L-2,4-diaminobutanoate deacetylase DoeB [Sinorhizobium meliloti]MCO5966389.1 N(2)-acetyl-L-2,4-diaminobutanoate deacetylase DoeB [Sinorhizobium meliloti]
MSELRPSPISSTTDFEADGCQHGFLRLPYSRDDSAWGSIMTPITIIQNGKGPTALLTGANHGDEYEGTIALFDLARYLRPDEINGRVIIVPAMNYPAFQAGTRTSPIDRMNLNRAFPGRPDGTVTEKIADYFQRVLLPMADVVVDLHSGGKTLDFLPFCASHIVPDKVKEAESFRLVQAFGAPYSVKMLEIDTVGVYETAAEEMGKVVFSTELGGGGTSTFSSVDRTKRGLRNSLKAAGIIKGKPEQLPTQWLDMPDADCFIFAEHTGLIEFCVDLGSMVAKGDSIARIWPIDRTGVDPSVLLARRSGIVMGRHFPGLVKIGDCVATLGEILDRQ